jgi:D-3-phosphoglycerate dehydrogenase / 2-oxoglutarate reductase
MYKVLLSAPYMIPFIDRFQPVFEHYKIDLIVPPVRERLSDKELLAHAGQFDGAVVGDDSFTPEVLKACLPRLKVISKWGTGIDSIDRETAERLGILVCNTPNAFTLPVADTVIGYILAFARQQPWMDKAMRNGKWEKPLCRSLSECTLGVVGMGNIGKAVLRRARGFGMKLLGNDIIPIAADFLLENGVTSVNLRELLEASDFISLNCDLNPTSHHLINIKALSLVKSGAVVINTARGPIVEEAALIDALRNGKIAGAALDVFENEPLPLDSPLRKMDNVLLSPHNSNSSPAAWERVHWNTIRNLLEGLGIAADDLATFQ